MSHDIDSTDYKGRHSGCCRLFSLWPQHVPFAPKGRVFGSIGESTWVK